MFVFRSPPLDVSTMGRGWGVGPQVNKFEQVSSDDHQMSVAGDRSGEGARSPGLMSRGKGYPTM